MVNRLGRRLACVGVTDAVVGRHLKQHGDLLAFAGHAREVGNDLRNIGLYTTGIHRVDDAESMYFLSFHVDSDILQIDLETIDDLPSAIAF